MAVTLDGLNSMRDVYKIYIVSGGYGPSGNTPAEADTGLYGNATGATRYGHSESIQSLKIGRAHV